MGNAKSTAVTVFFLLALASTPLAASVPRLEFHAPEGLGRMVERLDRVDRADLERIQELVGLNDAGPPIPVHLALEGSAAAKRAPIWGVAYATASGRIVLIPSRVPGYPHRRLETVLLHEVTHVLIQRAADGHAVPRWFHEGLALYSARDWGLEDRSRVLWATLRGRESALERLDGRFTGEAHAVTGAYAFSGAFMRFLIDRHGRRTPGKVLAAVAAGSSFEEAFAKAAGSSLAATEARFFRHLDFWNKWVPVLTSSTTLWALISLLALYAFKRRRARDAEMKAQWEAEDAWSDEEPTRWIH